MPVLFFQVFVFATIVAAAALGGRRWRIGATVFWGFWTVTMVFMLWLAVLQAATIVVANLVGKQFEPMQGASSA